MVIEKLILENYRTIYTAMNCHRIEIDFTKRKNRICMLVAPNGGGKTSILSALTPFATLGNLDIRDGISLILEKEKGYKEIHYRNGSDKYIIKHFYTPSSTGSHSVKSYIEKNGTELNVNGNVTSFKDIVKMELDIEMDYLKLIRIGNNVTNLLQMKTTERKNFMSKLLHDTDIYLKMYKKISTNITQIRAMINHTLDKIRKTNIQNVDDVLAQCLQMEDEIKNRKDRLKKEQDKLAVLSSKLSEYPKPVEIKEQSKELAKQLKKLEKAMEKNYQLVDIEQEILSLEKSLKDAELARSETRASISSKQESLEAYVKEKNQLALDIQREKTNSNVISVENIILDLEYKIRNQEPLFQGKSFSYTKKELETLMEFLAKQDEILNTIYSFGREPLERVLKLQEDEIPIAQYIETSISELEHSELENACRTILHHLKKELPEGDCPTKFPACPYFQFYERILELKYQHSEEGKDETLSMLQCMEIIYKGLKQFFDSFSEVNDLISKMPKKIQEKYTVKQVLDKIVHMQPVYPKSLLYDLLSEITDYENIQDMKDELVRRNAELEQLKKSSSYGYMTERYSTVERIISDNMEFIDDQKEVLVEYEDDILHLTDELENYHELKKLIGHQREIEDSHNHLASLLEEITGLNDQFLTLNFSTKTEESAISDLENAYRNTLYRVRDYQLLKTELDRYNEVYDEACLIRDAWSTKEGIPLKYIQMHLDGIRDEANDLLDIVYKGKSYIVDFDITDKEFKIPFVTKGNLVEDASFASQGEESFLSIALSFALTSKSLRSYNIMLLDEIDATLDSKNRLGFISMLDKQDEKIRAEQTFLISHNNMFDMYDVDVLYLYPEDAGETQSNIIPIIKQ